MTTAIRPIAPASSPACSWSFPSVAETVTDCCTTNLMGKAPYFSTLARSSACLCVKLPVICALPPRIGSTMRGADSTTPSRTTATALHPVGGEQFGMSGSLVTAGVKAPQRVGAPPLKLRATCPSLPTLFFGGPADALERAGPLAFVGAGEDFV